MAKQYHSRSYHRYFENYAEKEVLKPGGGYEIQRVYVGNYYKADLTDSENRRSKLTILILYLLTLTGYFAGGLLSAVSATAGVAIATMPALIAVLFLAVSVFYRLAAPREMEIRQYRDSSQVLVWRALACAVCLGLCLAATAAGCFAIPGYPLTKHVPSLVLYALALACVVLLYLREKHTAYLTLPPRQERPSESSPTRYEMPE